MGSNSVPTLDLTIGALFIGVILSMGCWGAAVIQIYQYFEKYPADKCVFKVLVTVVFVLDTVHQALITVALYKYLISEYGNFSFLNAAPVELDITTVLNCIIVLLVQSFFVWRIFKLSQRNLFKLATLCALVIAQFALGLVYFGKVCKLRTFSERNKEYFFVCINSTVSAIGDAAIVSALICLLHRSRTGFKRNERMIDRLIMLAINAGLPTCICAVAGAITVSTMRKSLTYLVFYFLGGRLYTNSLLATLNTRRSKHGASFSEGTTNGNSPELVSALSLTRLRVRPEAVSSTSHNSHVVNIRVDTETEQHILDLDDQRPYRLKSLGESVGYHISDSTAEPPKAAFAL